MGDSIPDEILAEILSPALRVTEETFTATPEDSPFLLLSESSSAFLLVSKSWLRVATPLLYNTVILRSKAQAQVLAVVLTTNPALGKFIRKLRIEGGFAISMLKILQASPNISDIFLCIDIELPDNACGLCRGLQFIEPVRVIIYGGGGGSRHYLLFPEGYKLVEKLRKCVPTWKRLSVVELNYRILPMWWPWNGMSSIAQILRTAPNLATLVVSNHQSLFYAVREISRNPSLQRIRVKRFDSLDPHSQGIYLDAVKNDERLNMLFDLPDVWPSTDNTTPFVYPPQLAANPVLEDLIWSNVLRFVLQSSNPQPIRYMAPILVCKNFLRLGLPHLYTNPVLQGPSVLRSFIEQLSGDALLGHYVRRLVLSNDSDYNTLGAIVCHTPSLVELFGTSGFGPITWKSFQYLGECTGATLSSYEGIAISKSTTSVGPVVFNLFPRMKFLGWDSPLSFETEASLIPANILQNLVRLTIAEFDPSFLQVLSQMELPSLREVNFSATADGGLEFFQNHGKKLEHLMVSVSQMADPELAIFQRCPSITVLGICCHEKTIITMSGFDPVDKHISLERVVFKLQPLDDGAMRQNHRNSLRRFLTSLDVTPFPSLRQIEHPLCEWPTADVEISRNQWVRWAESLLERNIQLVDNKGNHWRPRLKYVPGKTS